MRTTIDAAGRVVVPKAIREAMRLHAGQALELDLRDGRLEIEPVTMPMVLRGRGRRLSAVPEEPLPTLTADEVRETLEQTRR